MIFSDKLLKVVSLGGGTGLSCLLRGLKHRLLEPPVLEPPVREPWISNLTAVVTVTDDGGSSGRLRNELKVLPPGDIRNCMVALATDESLLADLFQFRFAGSGDLRDHSFGNLFLTALTAVTGDFLRAIRVSSDVLAIRGRIYPSTLHDVHLEAVTAGGGRVRGESTISRSADRILRVGLTPSKCRPVPAVLEAIREADIVTLGPGSLFTSLIPNLLVKGLARALKKSPAMKVYVGNLMTQPGETAGFNTLDHLEAMRNHAGLEFIDAVILNSTPVPRAVLKRYRREGAVPVARNAARLRQSGYLVLEYPLLAPGRVVRHEPDSLADAIQLAYLKWYRLSGRVKEGGKATA